MAVISPRPRLTLCTALTLSMLAAACSLVKPVETSADRATEAEKLAADGRHADAARAYAELATDTPADHDGYELLSAEQWVAAGRVADAKQALAQVSPEARTSSRPRAHWWPLKSPSRKRRCGGHPRTRLHCSAGRGRSGAELLVHPAAKLRSSPAIPPKAPRHSSNANASCRTPQPLAASRAELFAKIRTAAEHGVPLKVPAKSDPIVAGWLQLGTVALEMERDPAHGAAALDNWRRLYPQHPGNGSVLTAVQTPNPVALATEYPNQIALLLPLSGRAEAVGVAVRDGFISAYLEQDAATRPRLRIYDVATETVAGAFQHAMQDGASFVVGPLTKEDVAALAPLSAGRVPVLALNFLADSVDPPHDFYQFALSPEMKPAVSHGIWRERER